jgi:phosphoserine phosphatase RsbU/P
MTSAAAAPAPAFLVITRQSGKPQRVVLEQTRYTLGRATVNSFSFPEDAGLSREHLVFERNAGAWTVEDMRSRNGTLLNGTRIFGRVDLKDGDRIVAGHLSIVFRTSDPETATNQNIVSIDDAGGESTSEGALAVDLKSALESSDAGNLATQRTHLRAFVRAGRELVSHQSIDELFKTILDISVDAVNASRGVLMTVEAGELLVRAHHGEDFRISSTVLGRVLNERTSLLILDAASDKAFSSRESIVGAQVRSILAVPLQTDERAIGIIYVDSSRQVRLFSPDDLNLLTVMANVAAIRIEHARLVQIEQADKLLAHDLQQAAELQRALLPAEPPEIDGFDVAGYNAPSRTVGGDYYDFVQLADGRIALLIADVAGKGLPAALMMSSLHARVHVIFEELANVADHVDRLNRTTSASCPSNRFVTFFVAVLNPASGELCYSNAGHNSPVIVRSDGTIEELEPTGPVLGISPAFTYKEKNCRLNPGDLIALFSDGVTEACNPDGEEFGEDRLSAILREHRQESATRIVEIVNQQVNAFARGTAQGDDITLVVARRTA